MKEAAVLRHLERMPGWVRILVAAATLLLLFAALAVLPLPVPPYLDFQVLYQTNRALLQGISPYDHARQAQLVAQLAHVPLEQVYVLPFPYPPWYALSTAWLALLPIEAAARVWFGTGLALVLASAWLLTGGWHPVKRLPALASGIFFLPVLGSLVVGQYVFPVLAGAALMIFAIRQEKSGLAALAAVLLTFKPHIGALPVLVILISLWIGRDKFARRALTYTALAGAALFAVSFLADRAWPLRYVDSLLAFRRDAGVATCGLCASLPVLIARLIPGGHGLGASLGIGILIFLALTGLGIMKGKEILRDPGGLISFSLLGALLSSPYLLNYDFALLLVPLAWLADRVRRPAQWLVLAAAYVLPFLTIGPWGRQFNIVFPLSAFLLFFLSFDLKRPLDVQAAAAYND